MLFICFESFAISDMTFRNNIHFIVLLLWMKRYIINMKVTMVSFDSDNNDFLLLLFPIVFDLNFNVLVAKTTILILISTVADEYESESTQTGTCTTMDKVCSKCYDSSKQLKKFYYWCLKLILLLGIAAKVKTKTNYIKHLMLHHVNLMLTIVLIIIINL